jgi:hypothetical protein
MQEKMLIVFGYQVNNKPLFHELNRYRYNEAIKQAFIHVCKKVDQQTDRKPS